MTLVLQPRTTVSIQGATVAASNTLQKVLFVGIMASALGTDGALYENIQVGQEDELFGESSMLANMIRQARKINKVTRFDAIGLHEDGDGDAAEATITVTGTATENGQLTVVVGSSLDYTFTIPVINGDTATVIGGKIATAITDNAQIPFSASNATGVVTLAFEHTGLIGNNQVISVDGDVAGVSYAITAFAGGVGDPTFTGIFDVIGSNRYQGIVWPWFYNTQEARTLLDARFNVDNKVLDGVCITSGVNTLVNHLSALNALNTQSLVMFCDKITNETTYKGPAQPALTWSAAAQFAAVRALRLTNGASIGQYVLASNGLLDAFGGAALASKPYFNTVAPYLPLFITGRGWTDEEVEQLSNAGGSVVGNNSAGTTVLFGEVMTTYKTDVAGNADVSFKFLNYVDTASGAREYFYNNLRARFAQSRLTQGDVIQGRDMASAIVIEAYCVKLYQDLSGSDFVLLQAGETPLNFFKDNLNVTTDLATGTATITMITPLVTQLRNIQAVMKIAFSTEG